MNEENKIYEISFLAKSEEAGEKISKTLKDGGFSIVEGVRTARIKLTYPVKKENFAYFGYLRFSGEPANIKGLGDKMKTEPEILRFSVVFRPVIKEKEQRTFRENPAGRTKVAAENREEMEVFQQQSVSPAKKPLKTETLSNEALEKKLEEILK